MRIVAQKRSATTLGIGKEAGEIHEECPDSNNAAAQETNDGCVRRTAGGVGESHEDTPEAGCDAGGAGICKPPALLSR